MARNEVSDQSMKDDNNNKDEEFVKFWSCREEALLEPMNVVYAIH